MSVEEQIKAYLWAKNLVVGGENVTKVVIHTTGKVTVYLDSKRVINLLLAWKA